MAAWMVGVAGGFAVPCAPLRLSRGRWADPLLRTGPQEPATARRQETAVRLEPLWNEHYAGLRRPGGEWRTRRGEVRWAQEGR